TLQREEGGRGHLALDGYWRKRLAPGQVEVDRSGSGLASRGRVGATGDRAVMQKARIVGLVVADLGKPAHRVSVELDLVDGLSGPIPRSSGGRSAVRSTSGTAASSASATAGCRFAAAVPDVQSTATGRWVACAAPSA